MVRLLAVSELSASGIQTLRSAQIVKMHGVRQSLSLLVNISGIKVSETGFISFIYCVAFRSGASIPTQYRLCAA